MKSKMFVACIKRLLPLQLIKITFKKNGIDGLRALLILWDLKKVMIQEHHIIKTYTMFNSGSSDNDKARTIGCYYFHLDNIDVQTILSEMAEYIEKIKTQNHVAEHLFLLPNELNYKTTAAPFEETVQSFINKILSPTMKDELSFYGANINGQFVELDEIPAIMFLVTDKKTNNLIVKLTIDSWSGRFAINDRWNKIIFTSYEQVQQKIYSATIDALYLVGVYI